MAEEDGAGAERVALENCIVLQSMIDISAENLQGLRTQCATSAELTQQEIRSLEGKLVKYFSRQLVAKDNLLNNDESCQLNKYPQLQQWLLVVGLCKNSIQFVCEKVATLEDLLEMSDGDIRQTLLPTNGGKSEEERRLINAIQNLRLCTECLRCGDQGRCDQLDLHWDSWDHTTSGGFESGGGCSPRAPRLRSARPSVACDDPPAVNHQQQQQQHYHHHHQFHHHQRQPTPSSPPVLPSVASPWSPPAILPSATVSLAGGGGGGVTPLFGGHHVVAPGANNHHHHNAQQHRDRRFTPPPTPPTTSKKGEKMRFPTTPPPRKRHQTAITSLLPDSYPLTKSKSHESQLANRIDPNDPVARADHPRRQRLHTEPGLESEQDDLSASISTSGGSSVGLSSSLTNSPMRVSPHSCYPEQPNALDDCNHPPSYIVPASPRTPTLPPGLVQATHRFTTFVKIKATTCGFCRRQMFLGVKCKVCKYRCHRDCYDKLPPIACVPPDHSALTKIANDGSHSPLLIRLPIHKRDGIREHLRYQMQPQINAPFSNMDTCSTTSSSSCNSSTPSSPAPTYPTQTPPPVQPPARHFDFGALLMPSDIPDRDTILEARTLPDSSEMCEMQKSNDSDKTMSGTSGSQTDSEKTLAGRVDSQDSQMSDADSVDRAWPRQNSLSFREWEIPYVELAFGKEVGTGRFGVVYRGNWHGEVAIKVFNMDDMNDENALDAFKQEVAMFRKTRHENLVLFMGACMKPPHLAIVTRLCKGSTLYTHVHIRKDRFNLNKAIMIAQQISQGMGYLHARGIVHKDLKTKNIFLESGKVVITDFGLFSVTKLCRGNRKGDWLTIPPGWLCYLAPEIVCRLRASNDFHDNDNIPFTKASDIYAFGTVWYELLCSEWPFKGQPPEAIIWQVGKGMKQSLANLQTSRDVKEILMLCWSCQVQERREFIYILKLLEKLPKKRLARSPSHPIHLSRSAESVF